MYRSKLIYYVAVPAVTFALCTFAYFLGWQRGKQHGQGIEKVLGGVASQDLHEAATDLTFFKTLKEDGKGKSAPLKPPPSKGKKTTESRPAQKPKVASGSPTKQSKEDYVVQISAFRDIGKAHELIDELKTKGYAAFTRSVTDRPDEWFRVFVGPYFSREKAKGAIETLTASGFREGFITTLARKK